MFGDFWTCTWEEAILDGGQWWDEPTLNFAIKVLCPCLTCQRIRKVSKRVIYRHMQKMVDPITRLGNILTEEVVILDGTS